MRQVLRALQERQFLVQLEKCEFHKESVKFLGYILTTDGSFSLSILFQCRVIRKRIRIEDIKVIFDVEFII